MRFMLVSRVPMDRGNAIIKDGSLGDRIQAILTDIKAEAAYFTAVDGCRGGFIVVDVADASQIPAVTEPLFLSLGATVEFYPVMTIEDLQKAGPAIQQAVEKHG